MRRALLLLAMVWSAFSFAGTPSKLGGVVLDRSTQFSFPSDAVDDAFRIDVVLPIRYEESDQRYQVVYVTDSNYLLSSAAATQLAQATGHLPAVIIVGIGYDVPSISDISQIRVRDFSPTCDPSYVERAKLPAHLCGEADAFLEFIQTELKPFIDETYRTNGDNTLVGYSFGGLFALHALFARNEVFDRYVIGSPSIEWDDQLLFKKEAEYAKENKDLAKKVYLSVGGLEGFNTIPNTFRMYERLRSREYPGLKVQVEMLPDETHMTAINATVMRGLRAVLRDESEQD